LHAKLSKKATRNLDVFYVTFGSKHFFIVILEPLRDFIRWKVFFLWLFHYKKPKGKFILSFITKVIGFSALKKLVNKNAKSIGGKEGTKHKKFK
jgi:hypothetical protein